MPIKPAPVLCALALAATWPGFAATSARAQTGPSTLKICNWSLIGVQLAVSYRQGPGSNQWVAEGWRQIDVETCVTLQVPSDDDFYLFADDGSVSWGGDTLICVDPGHAFHRVYTPGQACTDGATRGFSKRNMQGKASDTLNLTDD